MTPAPDAGHSRWLAAPFVWARIRLYYAPRPVQAALLLVLAGGLATAAYSGDAYRQRREAEREVAAGWRAFEDAAERADLEAMTAALDRVLAVRPGDPTAGRRKAALAALCADESDPELAAVLLGHHAQNGRLPEAAREARKVLTKFPKDWRAICVLAHNALQTERDLGACKKWLDELPAPDDPGARLDVGGLLYGIRLSDVVGRDAAPLRGLIVRRLLPLLRGQSAGEAPPQVKAQLIESYLQPFTRADAPVLELAAYWGDVSRLHDRAVTEAAEAEDIDTLLVLGRLTWPLFDTLVRLRAEQRRGVPADPADSYAVRLKEIDARYDALAGEVMGRAGRAWQAVRAKVPARHEPYYGLADLAIRRRDHAGAIRILRDGLAACGSRNELLELLTHLMCAHGNPREALALLWAEATKADTDPANTELMIEFARIWRDMPKIVFSRTLARADWNAVVVRDVVAEEIMELKAQPGGDLALGGADLAAAFMRRDLIDEYRLYVHPIVIGRGKPMFQPSDAKVELRLAETRAFGNGVVLLRYRRP